VKIEYVVRVKSTKKDIRVFDNEIDAIAWQMKQSKEHGSAIAIREVIRREIKVEEEVIYG
jgi:hypothetical protein